MTTEHTASVSSYLLVGTQAIHVRVTAFVRPEGVGDRVDLGLPEAYRQSILRLLKRRTEFSRFSIRVDLAAKDVAEQLGDLFSTTYDQLELAVYAASWLLERGISSDVFDGYLFVGSFVENGNMIPVRGVLSASRLAQKLQKTLVCSRDDARSYQHYQPVETIDNRRDVMKFVDRVQRNHLDNNTPSEHLYAQTKRDPMPEDSTYTELVEVLSVVDPRHHQINAVLVISPPGIKVTQYAMRAIEHIEVGTLERIDIDTVYSAVGLLQIPRVPFRAPHHSISTNALIGSGGRLGEVHLAHGGVLFMDDVTEFAANAVQAVLDAHRSKQTEGQTIEKCAFVLIASANPCPCGWRGSERRTCTCADSSLERYDKRLAKIRDYFEDAGIVVELDS